MKKHKFPDKFLWFTLGWKDLGKVNSEYVSDGVVSSQCHSFCKSIVRIGKDNEGRFKYCPKCLIKTNDEIGEDD